MADNSKHELRLTAEEAVDPRNLRSKVWLASHHEGLGSFGQYSRACEELGLILEIDRKNSN
jgi:hypothetical protein